MGATGAGARRSGDRSRLWRCGRSRARSSERVNSGDEAVGRGHAFAGANGFAHASQLIERCLREAERAVVGRHDAAVDLHEQRFELMAQIAHGNEPRHARAALERVQRAFQRDQAVDAAAVFVPLGERALRLVDEFHGFISKDAGDFLVEVRLHVLGHVGPLEPVRDSRLPERKRGEPRPPARLKPAVLLPGAVRQWLRPCARRR